MTLSIERVQDEVLSLGKCIQAPEELLNISNKPFGDGSPHIEIVDNSYFFISEERGVVIYKKETKKIDELLYWILSNITWEMSRRYELEKRISNQDSRRIFFEHKVNLLRTLNPEWGKYAEEEVKAILQKNPYDDCSNLRTEYCIELQNQGVEPSEAYGKACTKYPLPK